MNPSGVVQDSRSFDVSLSGLVKEAVRIRKQRVVMVLDRCRILWNSLVGLCYS